MQTFDNATVEKYRALFGKVSNSQNWKLPTQEFLTLDEQEAREMADAIVFFVGGAETTKDEVAIRHREGLVWFSVPAYKVTSKGYYHYVGA